MSSDDQLQQAVLAELKWEPRVAAAHIGVVAENGTVTLTGHVQSYDQKRAAEEATGRVKGVRAIAEEIEVRLPFEVKYDDATVATAAIDRLGWDTAMPRDAIMVTVEKGWLTLTGQVEWHFQKEFAEHELRHVSGVTGVSNNISIKPHVDTTNLRANIQAALHRSHMQHEKVHVSADGGHVKLTGIVSSWTDRLAAGAAAWAARGAVTVENEIVVA